MREEGGGMCGWGMVYERGEFLSSRFVRQIQETDEFSLQFHFISFRYVRPCPMGLFYFGVFILY